MSKNPARLIQSLNNSLAQGCLFTAPPEDRAGDYELAFMDMDWDGITVYGIPMWEPKVLGEALDIQRDYPGQARLLRLASLHLSRGLGCKGGSLHNFPWND